MDTTAFKILLDQPSKQPALGFDSYARALAQLIESSDPRFAIGIFGGWGSGKTTLMQAISSSLDPEKTISVDFSAWRYEKEDHLIVPLLDVIREALVNWAKSHPIRGAAARETAATIGKVITSLLAGISFKIGVPGALDLSLDANKALAKAQDFDEETAAAEVPRSFYHASFQALSEAFTKFAQTNVDGRIVIFVDDLDRCLPEGALEVLESMKLFFDLPGFVFVVGLDQAVVEWSIETKYGSIGVGIETQEKRSGDFQVRGADYIKKDIPITYFYSSCLRNGVKGLFA